MYSIHLLEVIFTGRRHNHYIICNSTIKSFCICEYEFLIDLHNQCTFMSCWWGNYENVFSLLTEEYHIPWGQRPRGIWYSWVTTFSYFLNLHAINVLLFRKKPRKHIHVQYCWQAYVKFIGTLSQTCKNYIHKSSLKIVPKAFHRQCCSFLCITTDFYNFFYYFSLGHASIMYNHC
jgi:hypothetical protein